MAVIEPRRNGRAAWVGVALAALSTLLAVFFPFFFVVPVAAAGAVVAGYAARRTEGAERRLALAACVVSLFWFIRSLVLW